MPGKHSLMHARRLPAHCNHSALLWLQLLLWLAREGLQELDCQHIQRPQEKRSEAHPAAFRAFGRGYTGGRIETVARSAAADRARADVTRSRGPSSKTEPSSPASTCFVVLRLVPHKLSLMSSGFYSSYLKILNPATGTALTLTSERNPVGRETIALKTVPGIPNIEQATANIPESAPAVEDHRRKKKKHAGAWRQK